MAEAAGAGATPLHGRLPEEIFLWEILVRLPPKSLLRCRAVCRAWRRATSARDFLLAHHGRQPSLPVICGYEYARGHYSQSFLTLDNRAADDAQLRHVDRLDDLFHLEASCDGIFILSKDNRQYYVRNPATRQSARLQVIDGFKVLGMYQHGPTGEYRLLLYWEKLWYKNPASSGRDGPFIFALGSGQPPRHIGCLEAKEVMYHSAGLLFRGSLHWHQSEVNTDNTGSNMLMVFDTVAESFRQMPSPVVNGARVFEVDGMLGMYMYRNSDPVRNIGIWVLQDYEGAVWAFKGQVEFLDAEIIAQFGIYQSWELATCNGDVLVLLRFDDWLLHTDIDGKLVANFPGKCLYPTKFQLKQSLVPHIFFPAL